jgi:hypothetical protein
VRFNATITGLLRAQRRAHQQWRTLAAQSTGHDTARHTATPEEAAITTAWLVAYRLGQKAFTALEAEAAAQTPMERITS